MLCAAWCDFGVGTNDPEGRLTRDGVLRERKAPPIGHIGPSKGKLVMPIKGLKDNAVKSAVQELNARLADMIALRLALKQAHWNLKGPSYIGIHTLLDQVTARVAANEDEMAERVQALGGVAKGTLEVVAKEAKVEAYPTDLIKDLDHVKALSARISEAGGRMRAAIAVAQEAGDEGTADIFVGASRQLDKDLWFLESHLGK